MNDNFKRAFWTHVGIAAGGIILLVGIIGWLASDIEAQASRVAQDRTLIRERSTSIAALAELKHRAPQATLYEQKLNAFLPTQEQLLDFPRTLDNLARVRKVALNFAFQGGQALPQGNTPGSVGFSLDVTGAYADIMGFLKDVEFEPPRFLATFDSFDLTRGGEEYRFLGQGRVFFK
ncbi:MAG: hypothetical protein FJY98_02275 [Candidatus Liptonbacteria bacterium]|nr:hypothetical protein [Candidatus Liptonbacteria bacterium]